MARAVEEAFRRCLFEYLYDLPRTLFSFLPHTDSSLFLLTGFILRVVSSTFEVAFRRCSWIHVWSAVHHLFFVAAYRLWLFQTDCLFYCVGMCQEQLKRRWGNAYFNQCIISCAQTIFFWSHSDSFLFWPTILFLRVCVSGALEEAFRRCLFEYMWNPPHTIHFCFAGYRLLPFLTDLYCSSVRMCHRQVKRPSGDVYLNTCHNLFFLGRTQTPVFSDWPFFFLRVYVSLVF